MLPGPGRYVARFPVQRGLQPALLCNVDSAGTESQYPPLHQPLDDEEIRGAGLARGVVLLSTTSPRIESEVESNRTSHAVQRVSKGSCGLYSFVGAQFIEISPHTGIQDARVFGGQEHRPLFSCVEPPQSPSVIELDRYMAATSSRLAQCQARHVPDISIEVQMAEIRKILARHEDNATITSYPWLGAHVTLPGRPVVTMDSGTHVATRSLVRSSAENSSLSLNPLVSEADRIGRERV